MSAMFVCIVTPNGSYRLDWAEAKPFPFKSLEPGSKAEIGSGIVLTVKCWGAIVTSRSGTTHGQWFCYELQARKLFDSWNVATPNPGHSPAARLSRDAGCTIADAADILAACADGI